MTRLTPVFIVGLVCFALGCLLASSTPLPLRAADTPKGPRWSHGLDLKCRKGGEPDFTKDTKKFGVEVFRDEHTGNLIYISETGSIAVVSGR
jgi:hypothetical protein